MTMALKFTPNPNRARLRVSIWTQGKLDFHHEDLTAEQRRAAKIGRKLLASSREGGRPPDTKRNLAMARRFLERRKLAKGNVSDTALKISIGKEEYCLQATAAKSAIDAGLRILRLRKTSRETR
jgi:hypothetical protein